jgi:hypothetical protein
MVWGHTFGKAQQEVGRMATTYTVTKVGKELSADKSHEHIEGVHDRQ